MYIHDIQKMQMDLLMERWESARAGEFDEWLCIGWHKKVALWGSQRLFSGSPLPQLSEIAKSVTSSNNMPCGNAMIDAHVENLMDSKADHRFTTIAWTGLRPAHNHLDKCKAFTHITTRLTITNLIYQKNKTEKEKPTLTKQSK